MKTVHKVIDDIIQRIVLADQESDQDTIYHLTLEFDTYLEGEEDKSLVMNEIRSVVSTCTDTAVTDFFFGVIEENKWFH